MKKRFTSVSCIFNATNLSISYKGHLSSATAAKCTMNATSKVATKKVRVFKQ